MIRKLPLGAFQEIVGCSCIAGNAYPFAGFAKKSNCSGQLQT